MPPLPPEFSHRADLGLLLVGLALLYIASRSAVDALLSPDDPSPGRRAFAHHLPIAAITIAAILLHQPILAIATLFGTSVASLALGCGSIALSSNTVIDPPPIWRRLWPFTVVVAILSFLVGLTGTLEPTHAILFFAEGIVLFLLWQDHPSSPTPDAPTPRRRIRPILLFLSILLTVVGAWATSRGAIDLSHTARFVTLGTVAATMISPMLILPMLGTGVTLAERGSPAAAVTTHIAIPFLNLCLWLPILIAGTYLYPAPPPPPMPTTQPTTQPATQPEESPELPPAPQLLFPILTWRLDTIVLLVLGLVLLPPAINRWPLARRDGIFMLLIYVAYLMVLSASGRH
ncbi:MAG TPA: hypothetical protein VFE58_10785 [Tepidisphaeraceae bacterium]|jgi:hypothetical protein|nr:hypothetical protein [Tepidisphaeraceae bacterium]